MSLSMLLLAAAIFGFILVTLILLKRSVNKPATIFLASFYLIFSIYCLQTFIIEQDYLQNLRWFYGWPLIIYSLTPIPFYFYYISICYDGFQWKNWYFILFIPFLLSVIEVACFYNLSDVKRELIIQNAILYPDNRFEVSYGFATLKFHNLIRSVEGILVVLLCGFELKKFVHVGADEKIKKLLNKWLVFLLVMVAGLYLFSNLFALDIYFNFLGVFQKKFYALLVFVFYLMAFLSGILPLYFPTILYGYPRRVFIVKAKTDLLEESKPEFDTTVKFGMDIALIKNKIKAIEADELFLSHSFRENSFAAKLNIPPHHLSYILHQHYDTSFIQYKNALRISYAKKQLENGFLKSSTVEALALACGFQSRSAFSKVFKETTGMSPAEYAKT